MIALFGEENTELNKTDRALAMSCLNCYWNRQCDHMNRKGKYSEVCCDFLPEIISCDI
ncbi:MAG: hypothetical protein GX111_10825 [Clostridiales bacterium]|nr:hypothetical protein [Clostridiales bacterium]